MVSKTVETCIDGTRLFILMNGVCSVVSKMAYNRVKCNVV